MTSLKILRDPSRKETAAEHLKNALQIASGWRWAYFEGGTDDNAPETIFAMQARIQAALDIIESEGK